MVERVKVKIRHQVRLYEVDGLRQAGKELIEVFLVQEHLMAVIATILKTLLALSNRDEVVITTSCANIEEISATLSSLDTFRKDTVV
jgi:hypothetical protein